MRRSASAITLQRISLLSQGRANQETGDSNAFAELSRLFAQLQLVLGGGVPEGGVSFYREWSGAQFVTDQQQLVDASVRVSTLAVQVSFNGVLPRKRYELGDIETWGAQVSIFFIFSKKSTTTTTILFSKKMKK